MTWRTFEIRVEGFHDQPFVMSAASRSKARWDAFTRFREPYPDVTFGEFAKRCSVRACQLPSDDGYAYVRRTYGVDVQVGARVRLVNEGRLSGATGRVVYPGVSTAHVHLVLEGEERRCSVHPLSVEPLAEEAA